MTVENNKTNEATFEVKAPPPTVTGEHITDTRKEVARQWFSLSFVFSRDVVGGEVICEEVNA